MENLQWLIIPDPDLRPCPILQHTGRILQRMWEGGDQRFVPVLPRFQEAALAVSGATPRDPIIPNNLNKSPSNLINCIYVFYGSPLFFCCISWLRGFPGAPQGPYGDILAIFQPMWFYKTPESQYVNICGFSRCLTRASNSLCLFPVPPEHRIIFYLKISKIMCFRKTKNYNFV